MASCSRWTVRQRSVVVRALALAVASSLDGGGPQARASSSASALREGFPAQAALVLEQGEPFVATGEGFALERLSARGDGQRVDLALPRDGRDPFRFHGCGGVEVRVRELGVEGEGALIGRAVAYPRAGGTSFWTAIPGGAEEWLHLDAGVARDGVAAATWEVEGATLRQEGESVAVMDEGGWLRLQLTAPTAYALGGRLMKARLEVRGTRVELHVDAGGEAVLINPLWMPGESILQGRYRHTATLPPSSDPRAAAPGTVSSRRAREI